MLIMDLQTDAMLSVLARGLENLQSIYGHICTDVLFVALVNRRVWKRYMPRPRTYLLRRRTRFTTNP
jgi:hypothetical protein